LKFERLLETYLAYAPKGFKSFSQSMPIWIKDKLFQRKKILDLLNKEFGKNWSQEILFSEHHLSHAASAFFPSPFKRAAVLTMDAVGEWATTTVAVGNGSALTINKEINFPHSVGLLYSAFTQYAGFKVNSGEYKLMGLAPYGKPRFVNLIKDNLIDIQKDGSFFLDMKFFDYCTGLTMTNQLFHDLFGSPPRKQESELNQFHMDIASSIQNVLEEIVIKIVTDISNTTGERNLCLAGGVALNCVANGKIIRSNLFDDIWIQPAAGDSGGALGAALAVYHLMLDGPRNVTAGEDAMQGSFLGPKFENFQVSQKLMDAGAVFHQLSENEMIDRTAQALASGSAIGWVQGRMEFGPRALGNRSILADPRSPQMQKDLNLKIKFRESFRPFAPSILEEDVSEWFNYDKKSPYMLIVAEINDEKKVSEKIKQDTLFGIDQLNVVRSKVPAVTHVDYSSRLHTVNESTSPLFHRLIEKFKEITGFPILVNTSFNIRGEPIVCSPEDAFRCFMGTNLDMLVVGNIVLFKNEQSNTRDFSYVKKYDLD
jgi:carbamoyltransferase